MTQAGKSLSAGNQYREQLARKTLSIIIPAIIVPNTIVGAIISVNSSPEDKGKIIFLFSILFVMGIAISYGIYWYLKKQIVQPIKELTATVQCLGEGKLDRGIGFERNDELGGLAFDLYNAGIKLSNKQQSLEANITSLTKQIQTGAELDNTAATATNLPDLLQKSVDLIINRFNNYQAAIFTLDPHGKTLTLQAAAGEASKFYDLKGHIIEIESDSIVSWVATNNEFRVTAKGSDDPLFLPLPGFLNTQSEAAIPISNGNDVYGVLDLHSTDKATFSINEITSLKIIANQISAAINKFQLFENSRIDPHTTTLLFEGSHRINGSETVEAVLNGLKNVLRDLLIPTVLFIPEQSELPGQILVDQNGQSLMKSASLKVIPISYARLSDFIPDINPILLTSLNLQRDYLPNLLVNFFQEINFHNLTLYPIFVESNLAALVFFGTIDEQPFSNTMSNAITNLIEITKTSLERVTALKKITDQFTELQTLNAVYQSISTETNLNQLYEVIHEQIVNVMGNINFLIALYSEDDSTIEIPYMDDGDEIISVPPFPLGQGLTSIIIRTRQPLMIVEDTINRCRALGAIVTGDRPALSWLGVPIIVGEDILGAIVVQDLEQERRFNEDDMLLLTTLTAQIAISVRNASLMEETRKLANHEQTVIEISSKISQSIEIENILKTAVRELGQLPNVTNASVHLRAPRD